MKILKYIYICVSTYHVAENDGSRVEPLSGDMSYYNILAIYEQGRIWTPLLNSHCRKLEWKTTHAILCLSFSLSTLLKTEQTAKVCICIYIYDLHNVNCIFWMYIVWYIILSEFHSAYIKATVNISYILYLIN